MTGASLVGPDDVESWLSTLRSGECLSERSIRRLCQSASELLMEESNVQPVLSPVTIVGDLHGQSYDLLHLLSPEVGGEPPDSSYGEYSSNIVYCICYWVHVICAQFDKITTIKFYSQYFLEILLIEDITQWRH